MGTYDNVFIITCTLYKGIKTVSDICEVSPTLDTGEICLVVNIRSTKTRHKERSLQGLYEGWMLCFKHQEAGELFKFHILF